jgi:non-specific serine/threonine protein kinase
MATPNNLPAELSSFVGREPQLAELRKLLRRSRLITLTGPGGAGKTRLALRLASDVIDRYPDGVWLVELAALTEAGLLDQTIAVACGIVEKQRVSVVDVLVEGLSSRRSLIVLDGCEHLVDPCALLVSRLLRSCKELTILVTSREPLGVAGELTWRTPSLSVPRLEDAGHPELLLESEAVRLFVERARLIRPSFELDSSESAALAQICTRLEGIPLAIELAAGLARMMSLEEIRERLRDRFLLLTGGSRSALPRHQTLRQAVDWSYGLLSTEESALFARLGVFAGGFDLAAAESVAGDIAIGPGGVLAVLTHLVDKSLVVAEPSGLGRTRYRMLDTIREYALEKLQAGDEAETRRLHASYFLRWCSKATGELRSGSQVQWLLRLDEERANIRLALGWTLVEQPDDALRLAAAASPYWHMRRQFAEGVSWLNEVLELQTTNEDSRAVALWFRSRINWRYGNNARAWDDATECVQLSRRLGLGLQLTGALTILGLLSSREDDWDGAQRFHTEALQVARDIGNHQRIGASLDNLALGLSAQRDHEGALVMLEKALEEARLAGDRFLIATVLDSLGRVNLRLGEYATARRQYLEALSISAEFKDAVNIAVCLEGMALIALAEGSAARTLVLAAAATALRTSIGDEATPDWKQEVDASLEEARTKLGRPAADASWEQGGAFTMPQALSYVAGAPAAAIRVDGSPLTGREMQVAALVADGMSNPEIAKRLRMAGRTADAHVEHIRNKLGLRSRSQIAVWAHERLGKT